MRNSASNYRHYVSDRKRSRPSRGGRSGGDSFFQFLYVIAGIVIIALFYQLGSTWFDQQVSTVNNKVIAQVESGAAQIMPWGESEWRNLYSGSTVFEGDQLKLEPRAQIFLSTESGAAIRFGDAAEFELAKKSDATIEFEMKDGRAWIFPSRTQNDVKFLFTGKRTVAQGTRQFAFATLDEDAIRVLDGAVSVSAINDAGKKLDTFTVGVGQEAIIADQDIEKLAQGRSINFIGAISDSYKKRDWYITNSTDDPRGVVIPSASPKPVTSAKPQSSEEPQASAEATPTPKPQSFSVPTPQITSHGAVSNSDKIQEKISGTVDQSVTKVVVDHTANGNTFSFELKRFKAGSQKWNYTAVAGRGSNMEAGENLYEVTAYDKDGNVSDKASMIIHYFPGGIPQDAPTPKAQPTQAPKADATPLATPTPKAQNTSSLDAPAINSYNGVAENTTTEDKVKVIGTVDPTSIRVFVNGFALTAYRPGERQWTYYAATKYQTLKDGENVYKVYSVDKEGNRSPITEFKIMKNLPEATE